MNKPLCYGAFAVGFGALCWIGAGYAGTNVLALAMTLLIGAFYLMGALELQRFRDATSTLSRSLQSLREPPVALGDWLGGIHATLREPVRVRVQGERASLPGPAVTPYLAGLLVLLGMLGTFLGMVVTLTGTGLALESATDLQAIRASLAAPVKGLGLAFGTSVAGVAASAMLGLMSALCRRERVQVAQHLDAAIAGTLHVFSNAHRRDESFRLLQRQAEAMPVLVDRLQTMMAQMERQSEALNARLLASQEGFHGKAEVAFAGLAAAVDRSLKETLAESARAAGAAIREAADATLSGVAREAVSLHKTVVGTSQRELDAWTTRMAETFEQRSAALLTTVEQAHASRQAAALAQDEQRLAAWHATLASAASTLQREWADAGARAFAQQQQICLTLERTADEIASQARAQASATIAEISTLVEAAGQAPRAAADAITELRKHLSDSVARDDALLEERTRIVQTLAALLETLNGASTRQREAIDGLIDASASLLQRVAARFAESTQAQADGIATAAAQLTGSAVEVASLGEAFGAAVQRFSDSNEKLLTQLHRIEGALAKAMARSDEQLAYYVAQAREVVDLTLLSQKQVVDELQQLAGQRAPALGEA